MIVHYHRTNQTPNDDFQMSDKPSQWVFPAFANQYKYSAIPYLRSTGRQNIDMQATSNTLG